MKRVVAVPFRKKLEFYFVVIFLWQLKSWSDLDLSSLDDVSA